MNDKDSLLYCGFGIYIDMDSGATFEKSAMESDIHEKVDEYNLNKKKYIENNFKRRK